MAVAAKDQAAAAKAQVEEMQKQTTALQQQLEATNAAVLSVGYQDARPELRRDDEEHQFWIRVYNVGHGTAHNARLFLHFSLQTLPPKNAALRVWDRKELIGSFAAENPDKSSLAVREFTIPGLVSDKELDGLINTRLTLRVEGKVTYLDGFNPNPIEDEICYSYISYQIQRKIPNSTPFNGSGFVRCENFRDEVDLYRRRLREAAEGK